MFGLLVAMFCLGSVPALTRAALVEPSDPGFTLNSQNIDRQWGLAKARFTEGWGRTTGSLSTIVAVIDTGIDETHEDLKDSHFTPGYDFFTNTPLEVGSNSDDNGHGTLVAGVLGATTNNGVGIAGTNWQITLMPVKALDSNGNGTAQTVGEAIVWATDHKARVINLSLGGVGFGQDSTLSGAIRYAFDHNVVIVAAAGNDTATTGGDLDVDPVFPICDDNGQNMVIGVSAVDSNDVKPSFANYGKNCVDVSAPGKRILSTISRDPLTRALSPSSYAYASGTSLAAPFVSGQAALLLTAFPNATNAQIRDRIISTTDRADAFNPVQCNGSCIGKIGSGRINVAASLAQPIVPEVITEDALVEVVETGRLYLISGGKRLTVSSFVLQQRFTGRSPKRMYEYQLATIPEGAYAAPADGTLVKTVTSRTVYYVQGGQKMPITYPVFTQRGFGFDRVMTLSEAEVDSWPVGKLLSPTDGSLVRSTTNKTVYWVVGGLLHPISGEFYRNRGLSIFSISYFSDADIRQFPKGEPYF